MVVIMPVPIPISEACEDYPILAARYARRMPHVERPCHRSARTAGTIDTHYACVRRRWLFREAAVSVSRRNPTPARWAASVHKP